MLVAFCVRALDVTSSGATGTPVLGLTLGIKETNEYIRSSLLHTPPVGVHRVACATSKTRDARPLTTRWRAPLSVCYFDDKGRQAMGIYPEPYEKTCPRDTSRPIRAYAELLLALLQSLYLEPVCVRENVCVCVYVPGTVGSWTTTPPHESGARGRRHTWAMTETDGIYEIKGAILSMVFTPPKTGRAGQNYTSLQRQGQQATRVHR